MGSSPDAPPASIPLASLVAFFRLLQKASPVVECASDNGIYRWHTSIQHPWFNGLLASRPPNGDENSLIQDTVAYFNSRGVGSFSWWVEPALPFSTWNAPLQANGFKISNSTPGMVMQLSDLPDTVTTPPEFTIQTISEPAMLDTWAATFGAAFGMPETFAAAFKAIMQELSLDLPIRHYFGALDGLPVAIASLFVSGGVAGVYNVGVIPQARRQGLGAAITLAMLKEARQLGCKVGTLQSSDMGFRVYQDLGFRQVSTISNYYWSAG